MLSNASPPYADEVIVATRVRDTPFKRFLKNAQPGSLLKISEPSGSFTLTEKGLAQFMKDWEKAKHS
jgi:ferredoxin-NADP reductase